MFQYISSEEKSYLNVSLALYPKHANSPHSFVNAQRIDWQQYWFAEDQLTRTADSFKRLRTLASSIPYSVVSHTRFVQEARTYKNAHANTCCLASDAHATSR